LTRRANHRHIFIIARIQKARAGKSAAGFFNPSFLNRTAAARHGATSSHAPLPEASQAGRRPSVQLSPAQNLLTLSATSHVEVHKISREMWRIGVLML
jgi:hypothetical protein